MSDDREPNTDPRRLPWVMSPLVLPFWYAGLAWGWWRVFSSELASSPPAPASVMPPAALAAGMAVLGKLLGHLSEAGFYALLWRARGARLPFWRFLAVVVSSSVADQLAYTLAGASDVGGVPAWRIWIAGLHLAGGTVFHDSPAVRAGFGSLGLLTATRIGITAAAQARALNRGFAEALGSTVAVWVLTRLAILWGVDLMRGMSPVGGG